MLGRRLEGSISLDVLVKGSMAWVYMQLLHTGPSYPPRWEM